MQRPRRSITCYYPLKREGTEAGGGGGGEPSQLQGWLQVKPETSIPLSHQRAGTQGRKGLAGRPAWQVAGALNEGTGGSCLGGSRFPRRQPHPRDSLRDPNWAQSRTLGRARQGCVPELPTQADAATASSPGTEGVTMIETTGGPGVARTALAATLSHTFPPQAGAGRRPRRRERREPGWGGGTSRAPGSLRLTGRARASCPGRGRGPKPLGARRHRAGTEDPCPRRVRKWLPGASAPYHRAWGAAARGSPGSPS